MVFGAPPRMALALLVSAITPLLRLPAVLRGPDASGCCQEGPSGYGFLTGKLNASHTINTIEQLLQLNNSGLDGSELSLPHWRRSWDNYSTPPLPTA